MMLRPLAVASLVLALTSGGLVGCGSDPEIGDSCQTNSDCPETCQTGGGYPGGICTQECESNTDCPTGWACVSDSSGICLKECSSTAACADEFGDRWICEDMSLQAGSGDVNVCHGM